MEKQRSEEARNQKTGEGWNKRTIKGKEVGKSREAEKQRSMGTDAENMLKTEKQLKKSMSLFSGIPQAA